MRLRALTTAILLSLPTAGAFAAALDRSGQSISSFLQSGNYFEAGISILDPSVSGKFKAAPSIDTEDMADDYQFYNVALKLQPNSNFSFGLIYDQPFGAAATYATTPLNVFNSPNGEATTVEVDTQNLSLILGYQPTEQFNLYGGAVYQTIKGNVQLRGAAYGGETALGGYNATIKEDSAMGWLAGASYQVPEIALKASVTYRSEVDHKMNVNESSVGIGPISGILNNPAASGSTEITTPQSVNLDLQTGIMANTVAFANIRWVDWSSFSIRPYKFGLASNAASTAATGGQYTQGFNLVDYSEDQISATVGVGRKFNDLWAGNVSVGYDTGAGNPVSTLGPTEGYWNLGLGLQYSPTPATFISGGVKYFMLGDATAHSGAYSIPGNALAAQIAEFKDNDAWAYGLKIGYKF